MRSNRAAKEARVAAEIVRINSEAPENSLIAYVAEQIRNGYVLGMPTDTFYGLAADPFNLRAVEKVYDVKSRSRHKPLSLLIESVDQAEDLTRPLPEEFYKLARKYWPGPLTLIVRAASRLPLKVTAVVRSAGLPVTATSANVSGAAECTTADGVRQQLGDLIPVIVDGGPSPRSVASTIVDLTDPSGWRVLREGAIPAQEISDFLAQA
jgi:L-threonylcarbamoyladenylate synthase